MGVIITSVCLTFLWADLTDTDAENEDSSSENWIGAWWLPFIIYGLIGIFVSIPVFGFPSQFPTTQSVQGLDLVTSQKVSHMMCSEWLPNTAETMPHSASTI